MRILLLVYGDLGRSVSGPEIRGLALSRALAKRHEVTVAIGDGRGQVGPGIRVVSARRRVVAREALRHDVFLAPSIPPYVFALKGVRPLLTVSDQYDPVELEVATLEGTDAATGLRAARAARKLQLAYADVLLCANEAQRGRAVDELDALAPGSGRLPVAVVPFGLPDPPEPSDRRPLRERFPQIGASDRIVLWWGSVWRWLDAESAIRAVAGMDGVRLVITAGRPPNGQADGLAATEEARAVAESLGLLDRSVLFLDEWIPYEERHHYLMEADVGVTLHGATPEAPLAARARYMDYLWTGLPCVLAEGDELAERFGDAGFATLVPPRDPEAVREALGRLLADPQARANAGAASVRLAASLGWDAAVQPLEELLDEVPHARPLPPRASLGLLRAVGAEYVRLGRDTLAA